MRNMIDNVIILGAGASAEAGIPLMSQFMDRMWNIARLKSSNFGTISDNDLKILSEALEVRNELDGYHGRAALDVWNIEDILSVLSFSGGQKLELMTKAIARVIEITCQVKHNGDLQTPYRHNSLYKQFWNCLIDWARTRDLPIPPIITFNYDLVLERSLLHALVCTHPANQKLLDHVGIEISYSATVCENPRLKCHPGIWQDRQSNEGRGLSLEEFEPNTKFDGVRLLKFEILKLHGSVNFPKSPQSHPSSQRGSADSLIHPLDDPLILPPVFNKATDSVGKGVWERALEVLRNCKNIIICGYSLPTTDIYIQYFLKAALGPNQELKHIFVFDPLLFDEGQHSEGEALRQRYARNFSIPIQKRIEFRPWGHAEVGQAAGKMKHFASTLVKQPGALLFG